MKESDFIMFLDFLRTLERYNISGSSIEDTIINVMNRYEHQLTEDQKKTLLREFMDYQKRGENARSARRKKAESKRRHSSEESADFF